MLKEQPELAIKVGGADVAVGSDSLGAELVVGGRVDILLGVAARGNVGQGGHDGLAEVELAAGQEAVEGRLVQVREAEGQEDAERLAHIRLDMDEVNKAQGLLSFILEELTGA